MIANYHVKKLVRKSFAWELFTFDDIKKIVHFGILIHVLP
jgi:hypothetical protein